MSETEPITPMNEAREAEPPEPAKPAPVNAGAGALNYGAAPGKVDYMEARIASIEAHVDHIRDDIGDIRLDLRELTKAVGTAGGEMRELDSRIGWLPTRGWIFGTFLLFTAIICAVVIYLEQIRQYLGVVHPPTAL